MKRTPLKRSGPPRRKKALRRTSVKRRRRRTDWEFVRSWMKAWARFRCERCKDGAKRLHVHHMLPRSRGGSDTPANLRVLCFPCHRKIHDHTAKDWRDYIVSRKHG